MNSHNHTDDMLDLSFEHSLKNWVARKNPPVNGREQLLAAASQQEIVKPRRRISRFSLGWSLQYQSNLSEVAVRSLYGYALEAITFKTSLAMAIR